MSQEGNRKQTQDSLESGGGIELALRLSTDADISSSESSSGEQEYPVRGRKRNRADDSPEFPRKSRALAPRGGANHGKGKGSTAHGQTQFWKGQGLTAQGQTHTLTQAHSKEGPVASLAGPIQAVMPSDSSSGLSSTPQSPARVDSAKRPSTSDSLGRPAKRPRRNQDDSASESAEGSALPHFIPSSLIKSKEGTFQAPSDMKRYLNKYLRHCLSKEEREALFKKYPRPNLEACAPPKVDKFMSDFLGKRLPKERDAELTKVQTAILAAIRPLTSAWQHLVEAKLENDPKMTVPATEVLTLIQQTVCLIGNASELTSQFRRAQILGVIDPSWSKFSSDFFDSATDTLFGEDFQESLSKKVEKETALSKAVSIMKKNKRDNLPSTSSSRERQNRDQFF